MKLVSESRSQSDYALEGDYEIHNETCLPGPYRLFIPNDLAKRLARRERPARLDFICNPGRVVEEVWAARGDPSSKGMVPIGMDAHG